MLNYEILGFPFIRGFPSHEWNDTRRLTMIGGHVYECEMFHFLKSCVKLYNFRVADYKGVPFPWMKWNTSFDDNYSETVRLKSFTIWKVSAKLYNSKVPVK